MKSRDAFVSALLSRAGCPYIFGANGDDKFDCSGLILYALRLSGFPDIPDMTARNLFEYFHGNKILPSIRRVGLLYFYGNPIIHVMASVRLWPETGAAILIGARGGNNSTTSEIEARKRKALVDIVFDDYWKNNLTFVVDPFI